MTSGSTPTRCTSQRGREVEREEPVLAARDDPGRHVRPPVERPRVQQRAPRSARTAVGPSRPAPARARRGSRGCRRPPPRGRDPAPRRSAAWRRPGRSPATTRHRTPRAAASSAPRARAGLPAQRSATIGATRPPSDWPTTARPVPPAARVDARWHGMHHGAHVVLEPRLLVARTAGRPPPRRARERLSRGTTRCQYQAWPPAPGIRTNVVMHPLPSPARYDRARPDGGPGSGPFGAGYARPRTVTTESLADPPPSGSTMGP